MSEFNSNRLCINILCYPKNANSLTRHLTDRGLLFFHMRMKHICMKGLPHNLQLSLWFANMFANIVAPAFIQTSLMPRASNASGHCQRNSCITNSSNGYNEICSMIEHLIQSPDISQMRNTSSWSMCLPNLGQSDMPFGHLSHLADWLDFAHNATGTCVNKGVCRFHFLIYSHCEGKLECLTLKISIFPHACMNE